MRRSKNIQINSARLVPMMAANVVQHKTRPAGLVRARMVEPTHVRRARVRVYTRDPPHLRLCICTYVRIVDVPTCRVGVHIRGVHAEDQPPDPFRRCIYPCSLFSRYRFLFSFSLSLSFALSFSLVFPYR